MKIFYLVFLRFFILSLGLSSSRRNLGFSILTSFLFKASSKDFFIISISLEFFFGVFNLSSYSKSEFLSIYGNIFIFKNKLHSRRSFSSFFVKQRSSNMSLSLFKSRKIRPLISRSSMVIFKIFIWRAFTKFITKTLHFNIFQEFHHLLRFPTARFPR